MKGLHYVLRGDKPWSKGSFELQRSLLCGEVPGTWRRRFPQATAHRLYDWVVIIGEIHRELQKLLMLFEERIDATVHYSDCLNVEGGIRLGPAIPPCVCVLLAGDESSRCHEHASISRFLLECGE